MYVDPLLIGLAVFLLVLAAVLSWVDKPRTIVNNGWSAVEATINAARAQVANHPRPIAELVVVNIDYAYETGPLVYCCSLKDGETPKTGDTLRVICIAPGETF